LPELVSLSSETLLESATCNCQLPTHGGGNKGRVQKAEGGFAIAEKHTKIRHYTLIADDSASYRFSGGPSH